MISIASFSGETKRYVVAQITEQVYAVAQVSE